MPSSAELQRVEASSRGFLLADDAPLWERTRLRSLLDQAPIVINFLRGPELTFEYVHPLAEKALGGRSVVGKPLLEAVPENARTLALARAWLGEVPPGP